MFAIEKIGRWPQLISDIFCIGKTLLYLELVNASGADFSVV